jgi:hypothetical protein
MRGVMRNRASGTTPINAQVIGNLRGFNRPRHIIAMISFRLGVLSF